MSVHALVLRFCNQIKWDSSGFDPILRFIEIVTSVAGELGVGPTEGGEEMAFLGSIKADIVTA
jgi:hypothetical protein